MPVKDSSTVDVALLARGVSRIGVAVALAIDPSQDAVQVPSHRNVERIRHRSEQRSPAGAGAAAALVRNTSAPNLLDLHNLVCVCVLTFPITTDIYRCPHLRSPPMHE